MARPAPHRWQAASCAATSTTPRDRWRCRTRYARWSACGGTRSPQRRTGRPQELLRAGHERAGMRGNLRGKWRKAAVIQVRHADDRQERAENFSPRMAGPRNEMFTNSAMTRSSASTIRLTTTPKEPSERASAHPAKAEKIRRWRPSARCRKGKTGAENERDAFCVP